MANMYAKFGERIKVTPVEKSAQAKEYRENLISNVIDRYLDIFEEGLNNGFSPFDFSCCVDCKEAARKELNKIFENTPYNLYEIIDGLNFVANQQQADYFNYLMYLKDKYESKDNINNSNSNIKVLKPNKYHSYR